MSRPAKLAVDLLNRQRSFFLPRPLLREAVRAAWGPPSAEAHVVVVVVGDAEMTSLNAKFLNHPWPTDVLAFAYSPRQGEIIVNIDCARRESARRGHALETELALYVIHGVLHLVGYDDHDARQRKRMRTRERQVLASLGLQLANRRHPRSEGGL